MNARIVPCADRAENKFVRGSFSTACESIQTLPRFFVGGVARQHVLQLRPGLVDQPGALEGVGQGKPRGNGIVAPDRDLQGVDRIGYSPTPQIEPPEQKMRLVVVR